VRFGYHGGTAMKTDYSRIPRYTLKTLEAWIATGWHIDDDDEAEAFCLAVLMNDLEAAIAHADEANLGALPQIMRCGITRRGVATAARPPWAPGPALRACTPAAKSERMAPDRTPRLTRSKLSEGGAWKPHLPPGPAK